MHFISSLLLLLPNLGWLGSNFMTKFGKMSRVVKEQRLTVTDYLFCKLNTDATPKKFFAVKMTPCSICILWFIKHLCSKQKHNGDVKCMGTS